MNSETEQAFDNVDLVVGRAIDDAMASIEAGDIDHALEALERAIKVSESHPLFSKRATSEFHKVAGLINICEQALTATNKPVAPARALLDRVRALRQSKIH